MEVHYMHALSVEYEAQQYLIAFIGVAVSDRRSSDPSQKSAFTDLFEPPVHCRAKTSHATHTTWFSCLNRPEAIGRAATNVDQGEQKTAWHGTTVFGPGATNGYTVMSSFRLEACAYV